MNVHPKHILECKWLPSAKLQNSTIFITGATGLIGFSLIRELCKLDDNLNIRILALVRDREKAEQRLRPFLEKITLICGDISDLPAVGDPVDYIIHGASVTSSKSFVEQPIETILTAFEGTKHILDFAAEKKVKSFVYLSSMEVYGEVLDENPLGEERLGYLNPLNVRSSYPESKRMCENLCIAYLAERGVNVKIGRLAQTFGPGIPANDTRVFVEFIKKARSNEPIRIKTSGKSARMYAYTFDAVTAILTIMLGGKNGEAYNIANPATYSSIRTLAETIADQFSAGSTVLTNTGTPEEVRAYPPDSFLFLDTAKLEALGWQPHYSLAEGLACFVKSLGDAI